MFSIIDSSLLAQVIFYSITLTLTTWMSKKKVTICFFVAGVIVFVFDGTLYSERRLWYV